MEAKNARETFMVERRRKSMILSPLRQVKNYELISFYVISLLLIEMKRAFYKIRGRSGHKGVVTKV